MFFPSYNTTAGSLTDLGARVATNFATCVSRSGGRAGAIAGMKIGFWFPVAVIVELLSTHQDQGWSDSKSRMI
jgi:hypothetical protein